MKRKRVLIPALLATVLLGGAIGWSRFLDNKAEVAGPQAQPALMAGLAIEPDEEATSAKASAPQAVCAQPPCGPDEAKVAKATPLSEDSTGFAIGVGGPSDVASGTSSKASGGTDNGSGAGAAGGAGSPGNAGGAGGAQGGFGGSFGGGFGGGSQGGNGSGVPNRQTLAKADPGAKANDSNRTAAEVLQPAANAPAAGNATGTTISSIASQSGGASSLTSGQQASGPGGGSTLAPSGANLTAANFAGGLPGQGAGNGPETLPQAVVLAGASGPPNLLAGGSGATTGTPLDPSTLLAPVGNSAQSSNQNNGPQASLAALQAAPNALPEPGSIALIGIALCALFIVRHRRTATTRRIVA